MLVLSRKKNESIVIDGRIRVTIVDTGNNTVRIGIEAPRDVAILRSELQTANAISQPQSTGSIAPPQVETAVECVIEMHENLRDVAI